MEKIRRNGYDEIYNIHFIDTLSSFDELPNIDDGVNIGDAYKIINDEDECIVVATNNELKDGERYLCWNKLTSSSYENECINKLEVILKESDNDQEYAHAEADHVLCDFLKYLGYLEIVKIYEKIPKWYC
jgi:hypothetical protein